MRLAVLADIHGNLPALHAVQAELERLQPDYVVLNGDLINPVPFNCAVIDSVRASDWAVIRGNHEFYLLDFGTERAPKGSEDPKRWGGLHWLVKRVPATQVYYLATLPDELTLYFPSTQPVRVAHGVPGRNRVGFYQQMPVEKILPEISHVHERTIISAHTHVQVDRHISKREATDPLADPHEGGSRYFDSCTAKPYVPGGPWHLMNPGSIGLPLNSDPAAQFALMESVAEHEEPGGWKVLHQRVPYDRRPALEAFVTEGLLEAGGVIAQLFYWELVTAEPEIISYFRWCWSHGQDPDTDIHQAFVAYQDATGRDRYVAARDPLYKIQPT